MVRVRYSRSGNLGVLQQKEEISQLLEPSWLHKATVGTRYGRLTTYGTYLTLVN